MSIQHRPGLSSMLLTKTGPSITPGQDIEQLLLGWSAHSGKGFHGVVTVRSYRKSMVSQIKLYEPEELTLTKDSRDAKN
jgi:hypothetical protein